MSAIAIPFPPDWTEPVLERLEWLTDVLPSHDDSEQRIRLRGGARRSLEFSIALFGNTERVLGEHLLAAGQAGLYDVPVWIDETQLVTPAQIADTDLVVGATADRDLVPGQRIALVEGLRVGFGVIDTVSVGLITFVDELDAAWPAGTRVTPAARARVQSPTALTYRSDAAAQATLILACEDEWRGEPEVETDLYRGYAVLDAQTNWTEDPEATYTRSLDVFDPEVGPRSISARSGVQGVQRTHRWLFGSRAEKAAFRRWLAARAGRLVPCWHSSQQDDVHVVSPIDAGATTITVENRGYTRLAGTPAAIGRRDVRIQAADGSIYRRRILGSEVLSSTQERLMIDSPLGVALAPGDVVLVSFMRLVRLTADAVEIAHHTDEVAECYLSLTSLRDGDVG